MKNLILISLVMFVVFFAPLLLAVYSSQFYMNNDGRTATNGIFFHSTIELENYTKLGTATSLFCSGDAVIYTRSINHENFKVCK